MEPASLFLLMVVRPWIDTAPMFGSLRGPALVYKLSGGAPGVARLSVEPAVVFGSSVAAELSLGMVVKVDLFVGSAVMVGLSGGFIMAVGISLRLARAVELCSGAVAAVGLFVKPMVVFTILATALPTEGLVVLVGNIMALAIAVEPPTSLLESQSFNPWSLLQSGVFGDTSKISYQHYC